MAQDINNVQLESYWFVFFERGENTAPLAKEEREAQMKGHLGNLTRMWEDGNAVAAGPFEGDQARRGIVILKQERLKTKDDVLKEFESDPFVKSDRLRVSLHTWMTPKGSIKKLKEPEEMRSYVFVVLDRGEDRTELSSEESDKLQAAHLKHIFEMMKNAELGLAGPFREDAEMRGLFVFKHNDVSRAREEVEKDPLVQRKRLKPTYLVLWMARGLVGD